jgi:transposase-like protein
LLEAFRTGEGVNLIRDAVEVALQEPIRVEAAGVVGADRYQRTATRTTERNGSRPRVLTTAAGDLQLRIPKLRRVRSSLDPGAPKSHKDMVAAVFRTILRPTRRRPSGHHVGARARCREPFVGCQDPLRAREIQ